MPEEFSQKRSRSVVVTGVGLISPLGVGTEETWRAILNGRSGIAPITLFSADNYACRFTGEVKGFVPEDFIERKDVG
jgi:3-oxoacyl-[acyl-carrier-protein] synthase II